MNPMTMALVEALEAVNRQVPGVVRRLRHEQLGAEKEHGFAALLVDLGDLLHQHADERA